MKRRQFLVQSALTLGTTLIYSKVQAQAIKPRNVLEPRNRSSKVIIVGAGLSGLVAAYELVAAGHDVVILEARERLGGRILTLRNQFQGDYFVEAGAARIPADHNLTLSYIEHFGLNLSQFIPTTGKYLVSKDGKIVQLDAAAFLVESPNIRADAVQKLTDGFDQLPLAFSKSLENKIQLGDPVARILQTSENVQAWSWSGKKYVGDMILCTTPLTVLNKIAFIPELSNPKQQAIAGGYNYRPATRVFVEFPERFWEKEGLNGWGFLEDEELWHPTWDRPEKTGILHAYLKGQKALEMDASENQSAHLLDYHWNRLFANIGNYSIEAIAHAWAKDPWSMGGWAYPTKEQETLLFNELSKPEGRIYFAGEHTSSTRGWIQGALESGIRAAQSIHSAIL